MLEIQTIVSSLEREKIIHRFDPETMSWVVSDLRSKFSMQQYLAKKFGYFEDTTVLRANELWSNLLKKFNPDLQIVSHDFILAWVSEELKKNENLIARNHAENIVSDMMDSLTQIWTHPTGIETIHDWWKKNPTSKERWGFWAEIAFQCGQKLIQENKISTKWISAYLTNEIGWERFWNKDLIVDLGPDLTRSESELFRILAKTNNIQFLQPHFEHDHAFSFLLHPYTELRDHGKLISAQQESSTERKTDLQLRRLTSPLAEVKYVTAEIRQLLDQNIEAKEIAIIAPEIESYWPLLQFYFTEEGIPLHKDSTFRLQTVPNISLWMSRIRLAVQNFKYTDLENANYTFETEVHIRYEKFEALFKQLLDVEDLNRNSLIQKSFYRNLSLQQTLSSIEFLAFICSYWKEESSVEHLELVMKEVLKNIRTEISFQLESWIFWLEQIIAKSEIKYSAGLRDGVQLLNLSMADQLQLKYRYFLGITEANFKHKKISLISPKEVEKVYTDIGFHLTHQEQSHLEFELRWLLKQNSQKDELLFPMTEISGQETSPHRIWMELLNQRQHSVDIPGVTRHDELQTQNAQDILVERGIEKQSATIYLRQLKKDQAEADQLLEEDLFPIEKQIQLSPSALESYQNCPFQFAASRIFKLIDPAEADLDSSYMTVGNLVHALFETLTEEPRRYDFTETELENILNTKYEKIKIFMSENGEYIGDQSFWTPLRNRLVKIGQRFLQYEKSQQTSLIQTKKTEQKFSFNYEGIQWRGAIDRIDQIQGKDLIVYDYKPKNKNYEFAKWEKNKKLQVGFYAWAIQKGLIEDLHDAAVIGAQYYIYRNFEKKGIEATDPDGKVKLAEFYLKLEKDISVMSEELKMGNFPAKPLDETETCQYCRWSHICRAPHLLK